MILSINSRFVYVWVLFLVTFSANKTFGQIIGPEQDCIHAISVCQNIYVQDDSYDGSGQTSIVPNNSCLQLGENNSVWYIFTVIDDGILEFTIDPVANDDYDFALYDITGLSCTDIFSGIAPEVRCNYSSIIGPTGLKDGYTQESEDSGGEPFSAPLPVNAGETFALVVDNFTASEDGYTLDFSASTANIVDNIPPALAEVQDFDCSFTETILVTFSEPVICSSISPDGSNFSISGPQNLNVISAYADDCEDGGSFTTSVYLELENIIFTEGQYILFAHEDAEGNFLEDNCGNLLALDSLAFTTSELVFADFDYTISTGCELDTLFMENNSVGGINIYDWDFGSGIVSNDFEPVLTFTSGGMLNISLEVTGDSCVHEAEQTIGLTNGFSADFDMDVTNACLYEPVVFLNQTNGYTNFWFWDFDNGDTSTDENPQTSFNVEGDYEITFIAGNTIEDCYDTITKTITVYPQITVDFTQADQACTGQSLAFSTQITGFPLTYNWNMGDGTTYTDAEPVHVFENSGDFTVSLTVTDEHCGVDSAVQQIEVFLTPEINLGPDLTVCFGADVDFEPEFVSDYDELLWSTGQQNVEMISVEMTGSETIIWVEITKDNCTSSDTLLIKQGGDDCPLPITIPNAFTPDGDGTNDRFNVVAELVTEYEMWIYNRWGELVFYTERFNEGWDGTYRGVDQPIGAYVYEVRVRFEDGQLAYLSGNVTLLR